MKICDRCGQSIHPNFWAEHVCPEPFDDSMIAESLIQLHASTGIPMYPRLKAKCVVTLRGESA